MKVGTLSVRVSSVCVSSVNVVVLEVELVCIGDHLVMCWLGGEVTVGCGYGALESAGDGWVVGDDYEREAVGLEAVKDVEHGVGVAVFCWFVGEEWRWREQRGRHR